VLEGVLQENETPTIRDSITARLKCTA